MNVRLKSLLHEAESLPEGEQDELVEVLEAFLAARSEDASFTSEELEHIRRIESEPFTLADPEEVRAFFAGRG